MYWMYFLLTQRKIAIFIVKLFPSRYSISIYLSFSKVLLFYQTKGLRNKFVLPVFQFSMLLCVFACEMYPPPSTEF